MVTFSDWVASTHLSHEAIAKRLGVSRAYVTQLCHKKRKPSLQIIRRILIAADGTLTAEGLIFEFTQQ